MSKLPNLAGKDYPAHTKAQQSWLERHNEDWTVAAVLTADEDATSGQPITVVLRSRSEERKYSVDPDGADTLLMLLPR